MKTRFGARTGAFLAVVAALALGLSPTPAGAHPGHPDHPDGAHRVVYKGHGVKVWRKSGQLDRLDDTSKAFRKLVRSELDRMWEEWAESDPDCAQAPLVVVKEYRRRVAFIANQGVFSGGPGDAPGSCASGGSYHFYVKRDGQWKAPDALGGQDIMRCSTVRRWEIPRMNGARTCLRGEEVVRWNG